MSRTGQERRAGRAQQVALFRYQLIREAADPALSTRQRGRLVRELAARAHPVARREDRHSERHHQVGAPRPQDAGRDQTGR